MNVEVFRLKDFLQALGKTNSNPKEKKEIPAESLKKLQKLSEVKFRRELPADFVFRPAAGANLKKIAQHFNTIPIKQFIALRFVQLLEKFGLGTKEEHQNGFYEPILEAVYELLIHEYGSEFNVYDLALLFDSIQARRVRLPGGSILEMPKIYGKLDLELIAQSTATYLNARKARLNKWKPKRESFLRDLPQMLNSLPPEDREDAIQKLRTLGDTEALKLIHTTQKLLHASEELESNSTTAGISQNPEETLPADPCS